MCQPTLDYDLLTILEVLTHKLCCAIPGDENVPLRQNCFAFSLEFSFVARETHVIRLPLSNDVISGSFPIYPINCTEFLIKFIN